MPVARVVALAGPLLAACASHHGAAPEPVPGTSDKLTLRPALHPGESYRYHVSATTDAVVTTGGSAQRSHATLELDDRIDVVSATEVRDSFANAKGDGDGDFGEAVKRIAPILGSATVTTSFDSNWQVASSTIDGTSDDDARTMIMSLTPIVSFRLLPRSPVVVGDTWKNEWNEALSSQQGSGHGKVETNVHYTLRSLDTCGAARCATIVGDGEDAIPSQDGASGTSHFHGEQQVDVANVIPVAKTIESKTTMRGEQQGQPFEYTNAVTVRIARVNK